ncbi:transporter [Ganoderma sinense ZZ0214-1]|uniref:Molybdate-anion transporter n=1 Tax=Ganoderma sinense ZZ0214-1 TaxID=1077348 RepID=A0A2G8RNT3_9APHY|nr:transporter [Ganoderma sinense ZZ0214-1]
MASFYEVQFVAIVTACVVCFLLERHFLRKNSPATRSTEHNAPSSVVSGLSGQYLWVYAIIMGADWLQGPYIYSVYREQHGLSERLVALLFVLGFLTAGIAAPFVGVWADQHGRKRMCMVFCVTYVITCSLIQFSSLPILFVGRLLGGFSTAILLSTPESWLVASANNLSLSSRDLSAILGRATLVNSVTAAAAGIVSNKLVERTSFFSSTFIASGFFLLLGLVSIAFIWSENHGAVSTSGVKVFDLKHLSEAWGIVRADKRLLVLGLTQTVFEGSLYLFVFLWVPFLQESKRSTGPRTAPLPLGYIFSCFMMSMTMGSILYTSIVSLSHLDADPSHEPTPSPSETEETEPLVDGQHHTTDIPSGHQPSRDLHPADPPPRPVLAHERAIALHAKLSSAVCATAALAFLVAVADAREHVRFFAFCAFEACAGMYYPVQGMLRGRLVSDEHRATLSSLFRVPLNVFVTVSLLTGVSSARRFVLSACAGLLLCSAAVTAAVLVRRTRGPSLASLRTR